MKLFVEYEIDWDLLVRETLKGIRGTRSQKDVDYALNFNHDQVYRWESNKTQIAWDDFIRFCRACDCEPTLHFKSVTKKVPEMDIEDFAGIIKSIMGPIPQVAFCKKVGISRAMLNKWLQKKSVPTLIQMFRIIHYGAGWLLAFIERLTPMDDFKSVGKLYTMQKIRSNIVVKYPITYLIMMVIYTRQFENLEKYENGYLQTCSASQKKWRRKSLMLFSNQG